MEDKSKVYAVIAAYNEEKYIGSVIKNIKKHLDNVIVVDDGSRDETNNIAKENKAIVLRHPINIGKGAAIKTGCDFVLNKGGEIMILIDADGQHDPKEIPNFLESLKNNDIVFGFRKFNKDMPLMMKIGNNIINTATRFLYNIDLFDSQSGYRAYNADAYRKIRWDANDYSMESEMIANLGKTRLRYTQIPIQTIYSDIYKGTTAIDGIKIVINMILWKLRR
ncbi:MAG: glycosyltransferase family 2 protein [Candidatus Woesearchaeota archaeon]